MVMVIIEAEGCNGIEMWSMVKLIDTCLTDQGRARRDEVDEGYY